MSAMKAAVPATAPVLLCWWAATMAPTSEALATAPRASTPGSEVGSRVQDSSPRIARVANDDMSWAGGVITGFTTNQAPMGTYNHQRRVHNGTNRSGALRSLDQALNG
ncbi:MAG: hypothetical protein IT193_01470 [Propionibacteriaceae bacterium]|nr:hypothetical protein [Propionibacteriaceae bacterium]